MAGHWKAKKKKQIDKENRSQFKIHISYIFSYCCWFFALLFHRSHWLVCVFFWLADMSMPLSRLVSSVKLYELWTTSKNKCQHQQHQHCEDESLSLFFGIQTLLLIKYRSPYASTVWIWQYGGLEIGQNRHNFCPFVLLRAKTILFKRERKRLIEGWIACGEWEM